MKNKTKGMMIAGSLLLLAVVLLGIWRFSGSRKWTEPVFENAEYEGVFCTMLSDPAFSEEDFLTYKGLKIVKSRNILETFQDIFQMTQIVFENNPGVQHIYLELDPMILWESVNKRVDVWSEYMEKYLLETMRGQSSTTFEILLPCPVITCFTAMNPDAWNEYTTLYGSFVGAFETMDNVLVSYAGAEQWLNSNPDNYVDTYKPNPQVEKHIFLATFCDKKYLVTSEIMMQKMEELQIQAAEYPVHSAEYPDFSQWQFVFLGDSIIGIDRSSKSIPGVVEAMTGAATYNCAKNGATAAIAGDEDILSFTEVTRALAEGNRGNIKDADLLEHMDLFLKEYETSDKLCFFLNFGLNDYFLGHPLDNPQDAYDKSTYQGAMRAGIRQLQETYPQAKIVVLIPTYIFTCNEGNQQYSELGYVLSDYREAAKAVAEEMKVYYKDNYQDLPVNASNHNEYLSDECHLNEKGRFIFGEQLVFFLKDHLNSGMD